MFGSILLLNALAKFDFCSLIDCCDGSDDGVDVADDDDCGGNCCCCCCGGCCGVPFVVLSCCGINSSSIGFILNPPTLIFGVVVPLPVDWIELFILLLLLLLLLLFVVLALLLLIGTVALIELFIDAGGKFAPPTDGIDRPDIKPVQKPASILKKLLKVIRKRRICCRANMFTTLISRCWYWFGCSRWQGIWLCQWW